MIQLTVDAPWILSVVKVTKPPVVDFDHVQYVRIALGNATSQQLRQLGY